MTLAIYVGFRLSELAIFGGGCVAAGFGLGMVVSAKVFGRRSTMGARD